MPGTLHRNWSDSSCCVEPTRSTYNGDAEKQSKRKKNIQRHVGRENSINWMHSDKDFLLNER